MDLASATNATIGQLPAEPDDDLYNGLEITITAGTSSGDRRTISDYTGSSRQITVSSPWTATPDTTSIYSMHIPFGSRLRSLNRAVKFLAAGDLLELAGEDPTGKYAKYERAKDNWMDIFDSITPGNRVVVPFDEIADIY
jgi:hypothetical protein